MNSQLNYPPKIVKKLLKTNMLLLSHPNIGHEMLAETNGGGEEVGLGAMLPTSNSRNQSAQSNINKP